MTEQAESLNVPFMLKLIDVQSTSEFLDDMSLTFWLYGLVITYML